MSTPPPSNSEPHEITQPDQQLPDWAVKFLDRSVVSDFTPLQRWSPPEDPDKPRLPYLPGLALQIDRHVPPGSSQDKGPAPKPHLSDEYLESLPQSEIVVGNPPMETSPPANPERARLVVTTPIAIGESRGAQVVGCTVYPQPDENGQGAQPFQATAKIYDPLYYNFKLEMVRHARDVIFEAENDYSTEATAYEHLRSAGETGSFAPAYYGSWIFRLPISIKGRPQTRSVRLILVERLHGNTIEETRVKNHPEEHMGLDSFHYPEQFRLEVLTRAMDGFSRLLQMGLDQGDFDARNVFLVQNDPDPSDPATDTSGGLPLPRIVLIDYNLARITRPLGDKSAQPPLPENPALLSLRTDIYGGFAGWVPREWEDEKVEREWLLQRFYRDGQGQLYIPLEEHDAQRLGVQNMASKASASTPTDGAVSNKRSNNNQSPRRPTSPGPAGTGHPDSHPPTPPKLSIGLGLGQFIPSGTLKLPPEYPSLEDVVASGEAHGGSSTAHCLGCASSLPGCKEVVML